MITKYRVTDATVHDSRELANLIEPDKDKKIYADSVFDRINEHGIQHATVCVSAKHEIVRRIVDARGGGMPVSRYTEKQPAKLCKTIFYCNAPV